MVSHTNPSYLSVLTLLFIGEFACVKCDDATVKNELALPTDRWKAAHGDDAWTQATRWWTVLRGTGEKPLGAITGVFAPQDPDTTKILKLLLDGLALSYGLIAAGVWAKLLRDIPFFKNKGNDHAWAKDSAMAAVAGGVILAKDSAPTVAGSVATLNDLTRVLGAFVDAWAGVTSKYLEQLFSGSDEGIEQLGTYIKGGEWYNTEIETGLFSLQGIMENVLYGQLIPKAWEERPAINPVIVFQSESNVENPLTTIFKEDAFRTLKNEDALKVRTVYGGTTLWLLDAHDCGGKEPVARGGSGNCNTPFVQLLPGSDKLDGKQWGGVLVDDITISSFVGYQLNGNKNGYVMPENSRFTDMNENAEYPYQAGVRTPGFFSIPVCDINTVFDVTVRNGDFFELPKIPPPEAWFGPFSRLKLLSSA
ncbi:MAG: hypothetical protein Q9213_007678 [Squamulea squamosa]